MNSTYNYINNNPSSYTNPQLPTSQGTISAPNAGSAINNAPNIAPTSGVAANTNGGVNQGITFMGKTYDLSNPNDFNAYKTAVNTPSGSNTTTTPPKSGDQNLVDKAQQNLTDLNTQNQQAFADFKKTADAYANGAIPLTAAQQAQIQGLQAQYQQLIDNQKQINIGAEGTANIRGYQTGSAEYDPNFQVKVIGNIFSAGQAKVADLNTKMASAVAALTSGFETDDYNAVKDAYDEYTKYSKDQKETFQKTIDDAQARIKAAQDAQVKVQDDVNKLAEEAAKNGASPAIIQAITSSGSLNAALNVAGDSIQTATGTLGDYLGYKRQSTAAGHVPLSYDDWRNAEDARDRKNKAADAYATAFASESAKSAFVNSDKNQQPLEKDYKNTLLKELSNRSGGLGLQDQKVNQAIHLRSLFDQYYDPKTGNYNVPEVQYAELAMGLANLVSGSNTVSDSTRDAIMQKTAAGDFKGAITYITGNPQNGTTQEVLKNLKDSIDRQGAVAEDLRDQAVMFLRGLAPTDLDPTRRDALEKNTLASYTNPTKDPNIEAENKAQGSVKEYLVVHPEKSAEIESRIKTMEQTVGRPISSVEFLQAFPEYQ